MNNYFQFRKFIVQQSQCAMKVGTDGVLLGSWVNLLGAQNILDVGTGTGLIALMCAQRSELASIDAVEIDTPASVQAAENFIKSPWKNRLTIINDSFQHFASNTHARYDVIISNPPFFRNSLKPPKPDRSVARHDERLNYSSLFHYSSPVLKQDGLISVITPAGDVELISDTAFFHGYYPQRRTMIIPIDGKPYSRCLSEFSRNPSQGCITNDLVIKKNKEEFTDSYIDLTKEFYLKF
jgi:tRNA1Val (adenine37-N6)-methyltransferase